MARPEPHFDWHQLAAETTWRPTVAATRWRLRWLLALVALAAAAIFVRAAQLQWTDGAGFRAEAIRPIERAGLVPAPRGRILARDGSVLAADTRARPWQFTIAGSKSRPIRPGSIGRPALD